MEDNESRTEKVWDKRLCYGCKPSDRRLGFRFDADFETKIKPSIAMNREAAETVYSSALL